MKKVLWLALAAWVAPFVSSFAAGLIVADERFWLPPPHPLPPPTRPWPIPPRPVHVFAPLEVKFVKVDSEVKDQVSETTIRQEFYNPNAQRIEGDFLLPLPKGAVLDKFTLDIDGKPVEAELLSSEKARRIYEDIVRKARDPALMEYAGRDLLKVRVFPIEPRSSRKITVRYHQILSSDAGMIRYELPLSPESFSANPAQEVEVTIKVQTKRPLKSIFSPTSGLEIRREGTYAARASLESKPQTRFPDVVLYFAAEKDEVGVNLLAHRPDKEEDGFFLLFLSPGLTEEKGKVVDRDVVFVLDTSGSMAGAKLEQARRAILFCIENLNAGDRFEVIRFSSEVEPLFGKLTPAERSQRERASEFVKSLKPIGGTAIDDALKTALDLSRDESSARPRVVIFLTDGRPTVGVADNVRILENVKDRNRDRYRIFCFGIGTDVNTHLLDGIAEQSRAVAQYVLPDEDIELKVSSFYAKIKDPVLANPVLRMKSGDIRLLRQHPSTLPDVFRGDQIVVAGRYTGKGDALLELEGTVNGEKRKFTYELTFPGRREDDSFIARIWATRRIGFLLDEIRLRGENPELREEVTQLARAYGVVTPYTAYLIVEDESRRNVPEEARSLESLRRDTAARKQAADLYFDYQRQQSGPAAVAGSRAGYALQSAVSPDAATTRNYADYEKSMALSRPASAAPVPPSAASTASPTPAAETRIAGGRTFYLNNGAWVDSLVQMAKAPGQPVVLKVGTDEYFELLRRHPEVATWLAIGPKVSFMLDGKLFQTTD